MTLREQLLKTVELYCLHATISEARVSTLIFSGGRRIQQIRDGGDVGTMGFEKAMKWFADHWPEKLDWPEGVDRPKPVLEAAE
ncbi:hypothetical protein IB237_23415 [Agrobacterium sp. AGB01]|uniref:hypothetical protein n=1 Tax=Agrobacterium sp. AGB01 TaxID=2769302 RepID=UPI00177AD1F6|nr:hypothetical protein [Agrobacterium sp. AGB01]MBD9390154.1 hypothetical protein [Agrobacterium sp. AGB01]